MIKKWLLDEYNLSIVRYSGDPQDVYETTYKVSRGDFAWDVFHWIAGWQWVVSLWAAKDETQHDIVERAVKLAWEITE